ncbi:zf-HC2 domain-containing protein [Paenibacillus sp. FSL W8-0186]|uniref:anti-sigma factor family protein n=1 Tax=Paenibacillus sp. FSL W8-0186 TaxID=2921709 RepID=UPI0030CA6A1B
MKCAEVVEWMHRYIDHDLNDEETSLLFEHIRECSDCAEEFELLNELSAKLSELPDVTPRFSLVDRILPQLDEIDRARLEEGSAVEDDGILGSVAASAAASPSSLRSRSDSKAAQRSRRFRTGIFGTVAAAVILGIFITQYEPRTIPNAELSTANDSAESLNQPFSGDPFAAQSSEEAENQASPETAEHPGAAQKASPDSAGDADSLTGDGQSSSPGASAPEKRADLKNDGGNKDTSSGADADANMGFGGGAGRPTADYSGGADSRSVQHNGAAEGDLDEGAPAAGSPANHGDVADQRMEMAPMAPDMQGSPPDRQAPTTPYGIAAIPEEWGSPDGAYQAVLMGNHLSIYEVNAEEYVLVKEEQVSGTWLKGEWSGDSTNFTYETDVDGSVVKHTVQVKAAADAENSSQNK